LLTRTSSKLLLIVDMLKQYLKYVPMTLACRSLRYTVIKCAYIVIMFTRMFITSINICCTKQIRTGLQVWRTCKCIMVPEIPKFYVRLKN